MADILDEASALVQCRECPWYKACVTPMRFSPEDLQRQIQTNMPGAFSGGDDAAMQNMMANMAAAAQSVLLEGCPVFIQRLRQSPELAGRLKQIMLNWGMEEKGDASTS
jgi:hypothetical protein